MTWDPGDRVVFTYGAILNPYSTAFLHISPAISILSGLEVLVHEVMAAITTDPCFNS